MHVHPITDLEHPRLRPYRTLRRPEEHFQEGLFVAEGGKVVVRLLDSGLPVESLLLTAEWLATVRERVEALPGDPEVFVAERSVLESIVGFRLHQGVMALARIPHQPDLRTVVARAKRPATILAIDGLANAENVGIIVRNAVAFGAAVILSGETSSSPYLRRAVRNSMGAVFGIPVVHSRDLAGDLRELRVTGGWEVLACETGSSAVPIGDVRTDGNICVVFGSEGNGIRREVMESCSGIVAVPMERGVDSLNVANAAAVVLYELHRRRTA